MGFCRLARAAVLNGIQSRQSHQFEVAQRTEKSRKRKSYKIPAPFILAGPRPVQGCVTASGGPVAPFDRAGTLQVTFQLPASDSTLKYP
jgi:hypothetical protein